jgi:hypothetical protein
MMTNIEKHSRIRPEALSGDSYLQSLLNEALTEGELDSGELEGIQMQVLRLLAAAVERYNRFESSSVPVEAAQAIAESIFYTTGLALKLMPIPSALASLKSGQIETLYRDGCRIMQTKLHTARHLYRILQETKIQTENESYNATIEGIQSFFELYNPDFEAHESPADIDYQLANPVQGLTGVEYMLQYLENLHLENQFCAMFDPKALHEVLIGYDAGYRDLLVNLFMQALQNALGCVLLQKDIMSLRIDSADIKKLQGMLQKHMNGLPALLNRAAEQMIRGLAIENADLQKYIFQTLPELSARLRNAAVQNALDLFFPLRCPEAQAIRFSMGIKMENDKYRKMLDELSSCRYTQDRLSIIKEHIHSLADMEDLLSDGNFGEPDTFAVLDLLGDMEIAVLMSRHTSLDTENLPEAEIRFLAYFQKYLQGMPAEKLKKLQKTTSIIEFE